MRTGGGKIVLPAGIEMKLDDILIGLQLDQAPSFSHPSMLPCVRHAP